MLVDACFAFLTPCGSGFVLHSPSSLLPERLAAQASGAGPSDPNVAQHSVVGRGEKVPVAGAPAPFAQRGERPLAAVAQPIGHRAMPNLGGHVRASCNGIAVI